MINVGKISTKENISYRTVFKKVHNILMEADDKYIKSFLGVKEYFETYLKDKIWDINLSIHANNSTSTLKHKGRCAVPTVNKISMLLPTSDSITCWNSLTLT